MAVRKTENMAELRIFDHEDKITNSGVAEEVVQSDEQSNRRNQ